MVHGFSMQKPVMDITVTGVGYWNTEEMVRGVVEKWGEVKKLTKVNFTLHGHTFGTDKWEIKLMKNKDIVIPPEEKKNSERRVLIVGVIVITWRLRKEVSPFPDLGLLPPQTGQCQSQVLSRDPHSLRHLRLPSVRMSR